jgi:uncharacterized protein (DUF697 family)
MVARMHGPGCHSLISAPAARSSAESFTSATVHCFKRDSYFVQVPPEEMESAKEILKSNGYNNVCA